MPKKKKQAADKATESPSGELAGENTATGAFPIVGIGASAGGLAAFEAFFSGMPANSEPGMAFVLVQHLAPDHKSILTELVSRYTRMQVFEVTDGVKVQPNCAYIIPPSLDMAFINGTLQLLEPDAPRGKRLPIDFFFRSLAEDQRERSIGVVLSGTGSDGAEGIRAIKAEGGMAMAQDPACSEYDGMPRSAIETGLVDYVIPADHMADQLIAFTSRMYGGGTRAVPPSPSVPDGAVKKIFAMLRKRSGHDFSQYKPNTVLRRVERRMALGQIERIDDYVKYLTHEPTEIDGLFRDLLIGVTRFFRDPDAFLALAKRCGPALFENRPPGDVVRVWVPGCSTGEEAYSIAILLQEQQDKIGQRVSIQVFATDIDCEAIDKARAGRFPESIAADLTPERLHRFFSQDPETGGYRITKTIRDMVVFSAHDLIADPPFSKLDILSCRNLLIYMSGDLQKRILPLFHYALKPGCVLFLGTSETVGEFTDIFTVLDRKSKLYQSRAYTQPSMRRILGHNPSRPHPRETSPPSGLTGGMARAKISPRELTERTLLRHTPLAGALVNDRGDILYLHGRTGLYLEPTPGAPGVNNIRKMAREGLGNGLNNALANAVKNGGPVHHPSISVKTNGGYSTVNLSVLPVIVEARSPLDGPLYVVVLELANVSEDVANAGEGSDCELLAATVVQADEDPRVTTLQEELRSAEDYIQSTVEELQTSNEEFKSSNEELQSINEELQSTNEELETAKEELQSINEELVTVNSELQKKNSELARANNDMNNLMAATNIATIFIDHRLQIVRYTPAVAQIINLIPSDIGRPIGDIASKLAIYRELNGDIQEVLDSLVPKQLSVQAQDGAWFAMRIQPYRTHENVIEGAVVTFVNISEIKLAQVALQKAYDQIKSLHGADCICRVCGKLRDDKGDWREILIAVRGSGDTESDQAICPDCSTATEGEPPFGKKEGTPSEGDRN